MCLAPMVGPCVPWPCRVTGLLVTSLLSLRPHRCPRKEVGTSYVLGLEAALASPSVPPQVVASVKPGLGN